MKSIRQKKVSIIGGTNSSISISAELNILGWPYGTDVIVSITEDDRIIIERKVNG